MIVTEREDFSSSVQTEFTTTVEDIHGRNEKKGTLMHANSIIRWRIEKRVVLKTPNLFG
jgi:hypothetical protein